MDKDAFIKDILPNFNNFEQRKILECMIQDISNGYCLEFEEHKEPFYGCQGNNSHANILYNCDKKEGYLAHELLHAELLKCNFANSDVLYYKDPIYYIFKRKDTFDRLVNCFGHLNFYKKYIKLGFKSKDFVVCNTDPTIKKEFNSFLKSENIILKDFLIHYINVKSDFYKRRCLLKWFRLMKLKNLNINFYNDLEDLIQFISVERNDYSEVERKITHFFKSKFK